MNSLYEPLRAAVEDLGGVRVGLKEQRLTIQGLKSGSQNFKDGCDRFKLSFPIAGNTITWEVVFDKEMPMSPPDVIFGTGDEEFCPCLNDLEGFVEWNASSATCLSKLLTELIREYSIYQRNTISDLPKFQQQWDDLCQSTNFAKNCEVHTGRNSVGIQHSTVTFLFDLPLNLKDLPPYLVKDNPGEDAAALQLSFQPPNLSKVVQRLFLSPRVENALGGTSTLCLPSYGTSSLKSYIEKVDNLLKNSINAVSDKYVKRKEMVACLLSEFHGSVVEYNVEKFNEVTLLLSHNNFFFLLFVLLDERFPDSSPSLVIQSVYHSLPKGPYRQTHKDFLYSPRWQTKRIAQAIREYLTSNIMIFKQDSIRACR